MDWSLELTGPLAKPRGVPWHCVFWALKHLALGLGEQMGCQQPDGAEEQLQTVDRVSRACFPFSLPTHFINGLAKATSIMWSRFTEDHKLGGTADVPEEGAQQAGHRK